MTDDIELKKPYLIRITKSDGQEIANYVEPGSSSGTSVNASVEKAGVAVTPEQFNLLVNTVNNIEIYAQKIEIHQHTQAPEKDEPQVTDTVGGGINLGVFNFHAQREISKKKEEKSGD